jgi:large subunit ribosomal protein L3
VTSCCATARSTVASVDGLELGSAVTVGDFEAGQKVDVSGDTMGRGFTGYQKRHGFSRGPMSHGSKNHRLPGSTGAGTTPGRIYPGKRMAGRYGGKQTTTRGLTILKVDAERNLLVVKGSVPGKPGTLLNIRPANRVVAKSGNCGAKRWLFVLFSTGRARRPAGPALI